MNSVALERRRCTRQYRVNGTDAYLGLADLVDRQGRTLVAFPRQIMLLPQLSSTLFAFRSGKCIGFMDEKGKQVITPDFLQAGRFQNGLAPVQPNNGSGLWSYINENGVYLELAVNAGH